MSHIDKAVGDDEANLGPHQSDQCFEYNNMQKSLYINLTVDSCQPTVEIGMASQKPGKRNPCKEEWLDYES
jgi:hypothetical protein